MVASSQVGPRDPFDIRKDLYRAYLSLEEPCYVSRIICYDKGTTRDGLLLLSLSRARADILPRITLTLPSHDTISNREDLPKYQPYP